MKKITYSVIGITVFAMGFIAGLKYADEEIQDLELQLMMNRPELPTYNPSRLFANYEKNQQDPEVQDSINYNHRQYPRRGERNRGLDIASNALESCLTIAHKNTRVARPRPGTEHGM